MSVEPPKKKVVIEIQEPEPDHRGRYHIASFWADTRKEDKWDPRPAGERYVRGQHSRETIQGAIESWTSLGFSASVGKKPTIEELE